MSQKSKVILSFRIGGLILVLILGLLAVIGSGSSNTPDETPPTVTVAFPSPAQTDVGLNVQPSVVFSEAMNTATINDTTFTLEETGGAAVAGTVSYSGNTAIFVPSAPLSASTAYTATVTTGAQDLAGNALSAELGWSFITGTDGTSPTVNPGVPASGQTDVAISTTVTAVFSEAMDIATINSSTFTLEDDTGSPVSGMVSYAGVTATFTPDANLQNNMAYTATVTSGAQDVSGNPLTSETGWSFMTIPVTVQVSWNANPESAVNDTGGGYKVYYSQNIGFNPGDSGVTEIDVPYVSGPTAPTSVLVDVGNGTYYFRVAAYSALNTPGTTGGTISEAAPPFSLTVP